MEDIKEGKGSFRAAMQFRNAISERKIHQWINTYSHCRRKEAWLKGTAVGTIQIEVQNENNNSNKRPDPQWSEEYSKWSNVCVIGVSEKGRGEEPENIYLK